MSPKLRDALAALKAAAGSGDLEAIQEATASLEEAAGELDETLLRIGRLADLGGLLATTAHEVRQPLMGIKTYADLMAQTDLPEKQLKRARSISEQATRMEALLTRAVSYSRGRPMEEPLGPVSLNVATDAAVGIMQAFCKKSRVEVEISLESGLPKVVGTESGVQQVVLNLLTNACEALEPGGRVEIRTASCEGGAELTVTDDGTGVPQELGNRLFLPFETTKSQGTGLGLHLSRRIAERCGGTLTLEPSKQGSRFRLFLPAASG